MLGADGPAIIGQGERTLDLVLQLAHVAGKRIDAQAPERLRGEARHGPAAAVQAQEVLGQRGNVLRSGSRSGGSVIGNTFRR